jgi:hypothetical protein
VFFYLTTSFIIKEQTMKTTRFISTVLGTAAILLFASCDSNTSSEGNPAGQSITDSSDNYRDDGADGMTEDDRRVSDTVDVKPMP